MVIPDYQTVMLPLLKYAGDGNEHHIRDAIEELAEEFKLSDQGKQIEIIDTGNIESENLDPKESLEIAYQKLHNELVSEILSTTKKCSASFFESLVVDVLTKWVMEVHELMLEKQ